MPERPIAPTASPATDYSVALLAALVERGVRHIVLSPGSRSQALALVAAELERIGAVSLHVRIDERVGGFLAVGLAVESGAPAVVITTSGTATANLHPAVLEAHHSFVPMIVLTADRPRELRGIRANQTTTQPGMYGDATRLEADVEAPSGAPGENAAAASLAARAWRAAIGVSEPGAEGVPAGPGPVQLNLAFREPLSAAVPDLTGLAGQAAAATRSAVAAADGPPDGLAEGIRASAPEAEDGRLPVVHLEPGLRTIVVAGDGAGPAAEELARSAGLPLVAEVSSRARFGPNLVVNYRELLSHQDFGGRVERVVVYGHPTLSREVPTLLQREGVDVLVVAPFGRDFVDPARRARRVAGVVAGAESDPSSPEARAWVGSWVFASRRIAELASAEDVDGAAPDVAAGRSSDPADRRSFARAELAAVRAPVTRRMLVDALWRFTWPHDRLILGASRLIREADRGVPGKNIPVHSNRGLAGIDGTIATAIGVSLANPDAGVTRVLLGDLAVLHDVGALLFGIGERRTRLQVIVGNDGGGTIFDALEVAWTAPAAAMERVLLTPQNVDIRSLAAAYGWSYSHAATRGELDQALSAPVEHPSIVEVPLPR